MITSLAPDGVPSEITSLTFDGVTVDKPELEVDGLWFMLRWHYEDDTDIWGFCIADFDDEGFRLPDGDGCDAMNIIIKELEETTRKYLEAEYAVAPITDILWRAWVSTHIKVTSHQIRKVRTTPRIP